MSTNRIGKIIHEVLVLPTQCETRSHRMMLSNGKSLVIFWAPGLTKYVNTDASIAYNAGVIDVKEFGLIQVAAAEFDRLHWEAKEMRRIGGQNDGKC